ncbi:hypothetical protein LUZ60_000415 [Juncus effusus]|nr:hypothetical protein LUZ60_000415 [Juncus effusus]
MAKSCNIDMISDLPLELKQQILAHLSIQESVRTSLLSSRWRHAWTSVSELVFDQQSLCKKESDATSEQFIQIVDMVLSQHKTHPISVFDLSATEFCKEPLDRWINELLKHPIEKFYLKSFGWPKYNVSSELYMLHKLKELRLSNCTINLPEFFRGFKGLKYLSLRYCTLKEDELEKLISNCPNLEMLALCIFNSMVSVNINSQKLQKFRIIGDFKKIHLITPCLKHVLYLIV